MPDPKNYTADDIKVTPGPCSVAELIPYILDRPKMYYFTPEEYEAGMYTAFSCYMMVHHGSMKNLMDIWHETCRATSNKPMQVARISDCQDWDKMTEYFRGMWNKINPPLKQLAEAAE